MDEQQSSAFWAKVQVGSEDECWPWTGDTYPNGFGRFQMPDGKLCAAHSYTWFLEHGSFPPGNLKHRCGNKTCQNIKHIRLQKDIGDEERFWKLVDKRGPDECWPWLGKLKQMSKNVQCGRFKLSDGRHMQAHRYAYELEHGSSEWHTEIRSTCGTVGCVNPAHWYFGFGPADIERFWSKVDKSGGDDACWEWQANRLPDGYGIICLQGANHRAHRVSYEITNGPIPDGMFVCHSCDCPSCVNPKHLFLGTAQDNVDDKVAKGRWRGNPVRGEDASWSILTEAQAREILASTDTQAELARRYGVHQTTISDIKRGKHWKHIHEEQSNIPTL